MSDIRKGNNMDYKQEMVKRLKEDCKVLIEKKIPKALITVNEDKGINTYRNLTKALAENVKLIDEYDWKLMYSEYTHEDNNQRQVAVWEQNSENEIRNHKIWDVKCYENTSSFSRCFKDNIELTPIQRELMAMKSGKSCLRGEGSTFGVLMSAINYAYGVPFTNIGIITSIGRGNKDVHGKILELIDRYLIKGVIKQVFVIEDELEMVLSNGNKITVISNMLENGKCYRFDVIYLCDDYRRYDNEKLKLKLTDYDRDAVVVDFIVVNDGIEYYDICAKCIVKLV